MYVSICLLARASSGLEGLVRTSYTKPVMLSSADREIRLGMWKIHVLHHAEARDVWGAWLLEELAEHGHHLSPGTLYPALLRMERNGWLRRNGTAPHARARQTFRTTAAGKRLLRELRREVAELYDEVVVDARKGSATQRTPRRRRK